jgi:hypothetical protein
MKEAQVTSSCRDEVVGDHFGRNKGNYPKRLEEVVPRSIDSLPVCPTSHAEYGYISEESSSSGALQMEYTVYCRGDCHEPFCGKGGPYYSSTRAGVYER